MAGKSCTDAAPFVDLVEVEGADLFSKVFAVVVRICVAEVVALEAGIVAGCWEARLGGMVGVMLACCRG